MTVVLIAALGIGFAPLGHLRTRASRQIEYSNWAVAGQASPEDIARLGFKKARVALGEAAFWPQEEAELSEMRARGIRPWLWVDLARAPKDPDWLAAAGARFHDLAGEWEIGLGDPGKPAEWARRYAQAALLLRRAAPGARLDADLPSPTTTDIAVAFLTVLQRAGQLDLLDALALHPRPSNPDDTSDLAAVRIALARFPRPIEVFETDSAPPAPLPPAAAAKWYARRMLVDLSQDTALSLAVPAPGAAYVTAVFDDTYRRMPHFRGLSNLRGQLASFAYERGRGGPELICLWLRSHPPSSATDFATATLESPDVRFADPVYVDLLAGVVYALPPDRWVKRRGGDVFRNLPVSDAPTLIAERSALAFASAPLPP